MIQVMEIHHVIKSYVLASMRNQSTVLVSPAQFDSQFTGSSKAQKSDQTRNLPQDSSCIPQLLFII